MPQKKLIVLHTCIMFTDLSDLQYDLDILTTI